MSSHVVEVMGGEEPARSYITQAIKRGKFVVTANKEVISKHKKALFNLAIQHQVDVFYEAAVGGGIPLIRTLKIGLAANRIESLVGILNGTTNYILTKMTEEKMGYTDALAQAQSLGFAEPDPSMDVSGLDTAYKLSILASVAFNADVGVSDFGYQGIDALSQVDIGYAHELGYTVKLLATGRRLSDDRLVFGVSPTFIATTHPLASVRNEYNAIYVVGNAVGESMLMGRGAGSSPTASAIVSDVIDIALNTQRVPSARNLDNGFGFVGLVPESDHGSQWYIRLLVDDAAGMLAHIGTLFDAD
ncbi:homoserine dehydrogenase, partial [bacterium]|nr:homoserine dehydrogenase [bacterium]